VVYMSDFATVARVNEIKDGEGKVIEANGKTIALFNVEGKFYAIDNTCKHAGGPLGEGICEDGIVTCPWHQWKYDVTNGVSVVNPQIKVNTYEVRVEGGDIKVKVE
jgi:NAD(P)H-dependent nitrite reductase small subunit